jgi:hypothetical protein
MVSLNKLLLLFFSSQLMQNNNVRIVINHEHYRSRFIVFSASNYLLESLNFIHARPCSSYTLLLAPEPICNEKKPRQEEKEMLLPIYC